MLPRILGSLNNPATTLELAALDLGVVRALQDESLDVPDMPDHVIAATASITVRRSISIRRHTDSADCARYRI
jgi:hypothetical protein